MPSNPLTDPNWATETTDILVSLIDKVRSQTTTKVSTRPAAWCSV